MQKKKSIVTAADTQLSETQQMFLDKYKNIWRPVHTEAPDSKSGEMVRCVYGFADAENENEAEGLIGALRKQNIPCVIRYMAQGVIEGRETQWAGFCTNVSTVAEPLIADRNMGRIAMARGDLGEVFRSMRYQVVARAGALEENNYRVLDKIICYSF
jgi:hypothetical protein